MSLSSMLNQTCVITRSTQTKSSTSAAVQYGAFTEVASGVACSLQSKNGTAQMSDGSYRSVTKSVVYFETDTDVRLQDRIEISPDDPDTNTSLFQVVSAPMDFSGRAHHIRVEVERVGGKATP